jgi:hypothetical protein
MCRRGAGTTTAPAAFCSFADGPATVRHGGCGHGPGVTLSSGQCHWRYHIAKPPSPARGRTQYGRSPGGAQDAQNWWMRPLGHDMTSRVGHPLLFGREDQVTCALDHLQRSVTVAGYGQHARSDDMSGHRLRRGRNPCRADLGVRHGQTRRVLGAVDSSGQSVGRRAWFASRATAQASATGPTCLSLSGLLTERIVWICPSSTSTVKVKSTLPSRSWKIAPG